ncbi:glutathione peroxidase [Methylopila turkensis]|nr:glutathione peroxidase [Methylopila turkensis]
MTVDRRTFLGFAGGLLCCAPAVPALAQASSRVSAASFSFEKLDGGRISLGAYLGKPVLVVNTASRCGLAGQLGDMAELWTRYHDRGLMIVAVPSNDFWQEPGDPAAIRQSGAAHGANYPFAAVQKVTGADAHPFYRWAARLEPQSTPSWNFHKYLVGADGGLAGSFSSRTSPTDPKIVAAIERELASPAQAPAVR